MTAPQRSTLARERLSRELRRLRSEARMTGTATAQATGMSQSKLSKIENGMLLPSVIDVERLVAEFSATRETRLELVELARQLHAEVETRRVILHRGAHRHQQTVAHIEVRATTSHFFQLAGVPSLLQSESYLRAVLAATPDREQEAAVTSLRARRARLDDPNKKFVFLLSESALRWRMGSADLMCDQIDHLSRTMRRPNVSLSVIPWTTDANLVALHGFQVYDERVVTISVLTGNATITDPHDVREYVALFSRLETLAARGDKLEALLARISRDHRQLG
ncbi:helix-turn-helix transcriptional regulator [Umezawaea sp. Da 62-37]|uniref:helix-turn-helix domain-containing protein n=1 Tax=Umezawaea sp. Da 62-37 TaxID=3075927 RepID=UPI0028F6F788|nr:helix-turn-helix transcriptional regulator [Umezawaea sp. Da 62-37]WNV83054.1 helix-turn-helix transcriptional regulator [Umezawaea sp. Da 62-37]